MPSLPHSESYQDFCSNDYLGFARSSELKELFFQKILSIKHLGSTGSRLLTGNSPYYEKLEQKIATYHKAAAGLLFHCGYLANLGLISAVANRGDTILFDQQVHASLRDGILLSRAQHHAFRHNDLYHLEKLLQKSTKGTFIVVESIYSTDGTWAPLKEMAQLSSHYGAQFIVDEAHAAGVFGAGLASTERIATFARIVTFGKALGVQGAIVLGSEALKDYLLTTCRPFIFTTALSQPQMVAIECAYALLEKTGEPSRDFFEKWGLKTPIHAVKVREVKKIKEALLQEGIHVGALRYPTVPRGEECLRICLHTFNSEEEVKVLYARLDYFRN